MEQKRELTKKLIAESFQELMEGHNFEKITIKMISDHAGIMRPTFYHHYCDKYELVEWIFYSEVIEPLTHLIELGMYTEAVKFIFSCILQKRNYYRKLFQVNGQNCLMEIMNRYLYDISLKEVLENEELTQLEGRVLTVERIASFHSHSLIYCIKEWLFEEGNESVTVDELAESYQYLLRHPLFQNMGPKD